MAEILQTLSVISFVIAGVLLLLAILFWFLFGIPTVIGDLSGRTARKSIAKIRATNEKSGAKVNRPSVANGKRPAPVAAAPASNKTSAKNAPQPPARQPAPAPAPHRAQPPVSSADEATARLPEYEVMRGARTGEETERLDYTPETERLDYAPETERLDIQGTERLDSPGTERLDVEETEMLGYEETAPLNEAVTVAPAYVGIKRFTMIEEVMIIHTHEVIE